MRDLRRRAIEFSYTAYVLGLATLLWLLSWIPVLLCPRLASRWVAVRWTSRTMWRLAGVPLLIEGMEHLPRAGSCIVVSNHASFADSFVLAAALPLSVSYVAKAELKKNPLVDFYLRRLGAEYVDRWNKKRREEDTRRIMGRAREGRTLLFFAEGGMSNRAGLRRFKMGAFAASAESGLPIVPVALRGTRSLLRPDTVVLRRRAVSVVVGPPIDPRILGDEPGSDPWTLALALREATREFILRHCGEPDLRDEPS
jgi:1-acyl-sn-glycerol-3-phosphate acyltransferase